MEHALEKAGQTIRKSMCHLCHLYFDGKKKLGGGDLASQTERCGFGESVLLQLAVPHK